MWTFCPGPIKVTNFPGGPLVKALCFQCSRPQGFPGGSASKESICNVGDQAQVWSLDWEDPLEKRTKPLLEKRIPTPVFWPGEFHGVTWTIQSMESQRVGRYCVTFTFNKVLMHIGRTLSSWVPVSPLKTLLTCLSFLSVLSIQKVVYLIYSYLVCSLIFEYVYSLHSEYYQHRSRCLYRLCRKSLNMCFFSSSELSSIYLIAIFALLFSLGDFSFM